MERSTDEVARVLIDTSCEAALEIGGMDPLSQSKVVLGVCIGPAEISMVLTAALAHAVMCAAIHEYEAARACKVNRVLLRHLRTSIEAVGDAQFGGKFRAVWRSLLQDLDGSDALRRIGYTLNGDISQVVDVKIKSCVDWSLRKLDGTGYMPEYAQKRSDKYLQIVEAFHKFVFAACVELDFDNCFVDGGFKRINLDLLPHGDVKYDVFISYRRADGDVYARLLRQELSYLGFRCFLDVESVENGQYDLQILSALKDASCFMFVKSIGSLNDLDDPDDHVRIELEAAGYFHKKIIIVAPAGVPRDMSQITLPTEVEYLRNYRVYKLDVGESYEFCVDQIIRSGLQR